MEKERKEILTRCMACETIVLDGSLVNKENYSRDELGKEYDFSDGLLSQECHDGLYGSEFAVKSRKNLPYISCKTRELNMESSLNKGKDLTDKLSIESIPVRAPNGRVLLLQNQ